MCSPFYAVAGLQTVGDFLGQRSQAKGYQQYMNAAAKASITQMNFNIQDLEQERSDAFDHAIAEIQNTRLNSLQLTGGVRAAVNETMSGRTADMIVRNAEGDTSRTVASIQDNYARKSNEIDLNRERHVLNTKSYLENLNASAPKMPSRLTNFVSFGARMLEAHTATANARNLDKLAASKPKTGSFNVPKTVQPYNTPELATFVHTNGSEWDKFIFNRGKVKDGLWFSYK